MFLLVFAVQSTRRTCGRLSSFQAWGLGATACGFRDAVACLASSSGVGALLSSGAGRGGVQRRGSCGGLDFTSQPAWPWPLTWGLGAAECLSFDSVMKIQYYVVRLYGSTSFWLKAGNTKTFLELPMRFNCFLAQGWIC